MDAVFQLGERVRLKEYAFNTDGRRVDLYKHWYEWWADRFGGLGSERCVYIVKIIEEKTRTSYQYNTVKSATYGPQTSAGSFEKLEPTMAARIFETGKFYKSGEYIMECVFGGNGVAVMKYAKVNSANTNLLGGETTLKQGVSSVTSYLEVDAPRREYFAAFKSENNNTFYQGPYPRVEIAEAELRSDKSAYGVLELTHWSDTVDTKFTVFNNEI